MCFYTKIHESLTTSIADLYGNYVISCHKM